MKIRHSMIVLRFTILIYLFPKLDLFQLIVVNQFFDQNRPVALGLPPADQLQLDQLQDGQESDDDLQATGRLGQQAVEADAGALVQDGSNRRNPIRDGDHNRGDHLGYGGRGRDDGQRLAHGSHQVVESDVLQIETAFQARRWSQSQVSPQSLLLSAAQ